MHHAFQVMVPESMYGNQKSVMHKAEYMKSSAATILIRAKVPSKAKAEFLQAVRALNQELHLEKGFMHSTLYQNVDEEDTFSLMQEWKTHDDARCHLSASSHAVLLGALKTLCIESETSHGDASSQFGIKVLSCEGSQ